MWFIHPKVFSIRWKSMEAKTARGESSAMCELLYSSCWVPSPPRGSACGALIHVHWPWKIIQEKHVPQLPTEVHRRRGPVCPQVNVHTKTSQHVPAFPSSIPWVCEMLMLSATEQHGRKRRAFVVLGGKVFCDLCTFLQTAGLAVFLTHCL